MDPAYEFAPGDPKRIEIVVRGIYVIVDVGRVIGERDVFRVDNSLTGDTRTMLLRPELVMEEAERMGVTGLDFEAVEPSLRAYTKVAMVAASLWHREDVQAVYDQVRRVSG